VSAGYCTAAGRFYDLAGNYQAFTQTSTGGTWAVAVPATFGTDVKNANPNAEFNSVSCVSPGTCTAAGRLKDLDGNRQAFTQTSTGSGTPLLPPTGANTNGFVAVAVVLVAAGSVLVATRRRRPVAV
jgi:LPXTG-motif cell wall-anchored protein